MLELTQTTDCQFIYITCCMLVFIQVSSVYCLALRFDSLSYRTNVAYGARIWFFFVGIES